MDTDISFAQSLQHITGEESLTSALLYGLSMMNKENLLELESVWPDIDTDRRRVIMQQLVDIAEQSFEVDFDPIFLLALNDPDSETQAIAIGGLWEDESSELIPSFVYLLKQGQTSRVKAAAATALGRYIYLGELEEIDDTALMVVEQALLETIRQPDEDVEVIRRAIEAIAFSSREGIEQIIENAYYHEDERMRVSAVFSMGRSYNPKWESIILTELDNISPAIRFEAVRACGELEVKAAVDKLIELIVREEDSAVLQNAVWALGQIGGFKAQEVLENLTASPDDAISAVAEEALNELLLFSGIMDDFFDFAPPDSDLDTFEDEDDLLYDPGEDDHQIFNLN
ncbi:MAG TPA: HEAT repeat domain-containing protein [Chloroflexi bacterium]|nr:HEAT repeat domain-containing protein [Chloroflexota bacterium]